MKKGLTKSAAILIALGILVIAIIGLQIAKQFPVTDKLINTFMKKFFPSKIESVVIPGTTVGGGCPTVSIRDVDDLAQAVVDCWNQGQKYGQLECCYNINPANLKAEISKTELQSALRKKGTLGKSLADSSCSGMTWDSQSFPRAIAGKAIFTVCYDTTRCNEVYVTFDPKKYC